ncbi:hypothetical protein KDI_37680 [Dictyobacter arantiisoli]|uniref:Type III-B CRISPR module RAMP protein Cmr6 n=2 Tax=Dictyobacter arantiisoli TaxID=2014874 RepID=A0A5A5TGX2_9CHLR|nr:hypothetical protein KDI_37680 [Dictyobacter arantiisoli]
MPVIPAGQKTLPLQCDIMTPHYQKYYGSLASNAIKSPTNEENPIPIPFLTVAKTTFAFALAPRDADNKKHLADVQRVRGWLLQALQNDGIGGKTNAGYGYFKEEPIQVVPKKPAIVWSRPNLPSYQEGQQLPQNCTVIQPDVWAKQKYPGATAFLRYEENSTQTLLLVIEDSFPEAQEWAPGNRKGCTFLREERAEDRLIWICKPAPVKNKNKGKQKK